MKASELISHLDKMITHIGDKDVVFFENDSYHKITGIQYDPDEDPEIVIVGGDI